jgi:hypothetical protein
MREATVLGLVVCASARGALGFLATWEPSVRVPLGTLWCRRATLPLGSLVPSGLAVVGRPAPVVPTCAFTVGLQPA